MSESDRSELKSTGYEAFFLLLSVLSIANAAIAVVLSSSVARDVAILMDLAITPFFVADFAYRLFTASSRTRYLARDWGWADLVAIAPLLRVFRVFRVRAVVRNMRAQGRERLGADLAVNRASATFLLTVFMVVVVVEFAGMAEFYVEQGVPGANITSAGDAIWWGLVTITTVGYGDQYPVGSAGRGVGALLLFAGIALFSVLTGFIANVFLAPNRPRRRLRRAPGTPAAQLAELHELITQHEQQSAAIRAKLHELERTVLAATERAPAGPEGA